MSFSLFFFLACFGAKSDDSAIKANTCETAREEFYTFASSLLVSDYNSCTADDECDGGSCWDICGVSCYSLVANTANYDLIREQLREFADENCQPCIGYEYEIYPEPVSEPPWCEEGECY